MRKCLTTEEEDKAEKWVQIHHPERLVPMMGFKLQDPSMFPKSMFFKDVIEKFTMNVTVVASGRKKVYQKSRLA